MLIFCRLSLSDKHYVVPRWTEPSMDAEYSIVLIRHWQSISFNQCCPLGRFGAADKRSRRQFKPCSVEHPAVGRREYFSHFDSVLLPFNALVPYLSETALIAA